MNACISTELGEIFSVISVGVLRIRYVVETFSWHTRASRNSSVTCVHTYDTEPFVI